MHLFSPKRYVVLLSRIYLIKFVPRRLSPILWVLFYTSHDSFRTTDLAPMNNSSIIRRKSIQCCPQQVSKGNIFHIWFYKVTGDVLALSFCLIILPVCKTWRAKVCRRFGICTYRLRKCDGMNSDMLDTPSQNMPLWRAKSWQKQEVLVTMLCAWKPRGWTNL